MLPGRILYGVATLSWRETDQPCPVEIDTIVVDQVGISIRLATTRRKLDCPGLLVDLANTTNNPLPFRDLILDLAGPGIIQV